MTRRELHEHVWRQLPLRRHMAGRDTVEAITDLCVEWWEPEYLRHASRARERAVVLGGIVASVKRAHQWQSDREPVEYDMTWTVLYGLLAHEIATILERWWRASAANRRLMAEWHEAIRA